MKTAVACGLLVAVAFLAASPGGSAAQEDALDLVFGPPTSTPPIFQCGYNVRTCANTSRYHTGIDYQRSVSGDEPVVAASYGRVAYLETLSDNDHGMGTNLIVEHELESGGVIYSSYSHLASIADGLRVGDPVAKGQVLGVMGGSGYGRSNYWDVHLHFELKDGPVTHSPSGSDIYWGYTPSNPGDYGYHDPGSYIGIVAVRDPRPVTLALISPNSGVLRRGRKVVVKWSTSATEPDDEISIFLKRDSFADLATPDGKNFIQLTGAEANDGSYKTTVPAAAVLARDWRCYITHNASGVSDASDAVLRLRK